MVAAVLLPNAKAAFITSAGLPAVGYKLKTYDAGTLTPRPTYLDAAGIGSNTNPIILDARGEAVIYWSGSYKVILTDPNDVVIWTADNFSAAPYTGTTTNDSAAAGIVGEFMSATVANATTGLTTNVASTTASLALTAGDWDVSINAWFDGDPTTLIDRVIASLSLVAATLDSSFGRRSDAIGFHLAAFSMGRLCPVVGPTRFSLAAPATVYFVSQAVFSVSTCGTGGIIRARRMR